MFTAETQIRVRYADTDQMGYVYYGVYAQYFEVARVELFRSMGIRYKDLETQGIIMPVLELRTKYIRPARYDDLLTIKTTILEMPQMRIAFDYEVFNEQGTLLNVGTTRLVFVNQATGRPCELPTALRDALVPHFSSQAPR